MDRLFDLQRIERETFVASVQHRHETESTNDLALELIRDARCPLPLLVLATRQTRGRGRGANVWWSADGGLTSSLVVETAGMASLRGGQSLVSLITALAVCQAIEGLSTDIRARLKWPNDVLLGRRKVCGILAEVPARPRDRMVIGVGINVNNSLATAPRDVRRRAISLADAAGRPFDLTEVLVGFLSQFNSLFTDFQRGELRPSQACAPWCALTGHHVSLKLGSRRVAGECRGIDDDGALIISGDGEQRCLSGVIESVGWDD